MEVGLIHRTHHILTNIQRTGGSILRPPTDQCIIIGSRMTDFPINLRNIIVHPTIVHPHQHISIQIVIILQTACVAAIGVTLHITINSKRRNSKLHPRLALAHRLMDFLYQHIHVVTSPIGFITVSATILCKTDIVGEILSRIRIRIKIIIHVNGIHIITGNNIAYNLTNIFTILR